jgi:hypothetical protein
MQNSEKAIMCHCEVHAQNPVDPAVPQACIASVNLRLTGRKAGDAYVPAVSRDQMSRFSPSVFSALGSNPSIRRRPAPLPQCYHTRNEWGWVIRCVWSSIRVLESRQHCRAAARLNTRIRPHCRSGDLLPNASQSMEL